MKTHIRLNFLLFLVGFNGVIFIPSLAGGGTLKNHIGEMEEERKGNSLYQPKIEHWLKMSSDSIERKSLAIDLHRQAHDENIRGEERKFFRLIELAAKLGNSNAQYDLGLIFKEGLVVEKDDKEAVKWFQKAAAQNHAAGQYNLGLMYKDARGIKGNDKEAVNLFRKAAEQNDAYAQFNLGWMYENGRGVEKSDKEAAEWYRKAAKQNDASGQYNLGRMYENGRGVEKNAKEAAEWYKKAAKQNDSYAQYRLGLMYDYGQGVKQDDKKAIKWCREAAEHKHVDALRHLKWKAEKNDAYAQFNLGSMYENGRGVGKNDKEAVKWYRKAAEQNYPSSKLALERIESSLRK